MYYNNSPEIPYAKGEYAVSFDVAAKTGYNAASKIPGGTLTLIDPWMEMTTSATDIEFSLLGSGTATVHWGSGEPTTHPISDVATSFSPAAPLPEGEKTIRVDIWREHEYGPNYGFVTIMNANEMGLTSIDISNSPALDTLNCSYNDLNGIDLSHNPALTSFSCSASGLETLNISNNPALDTLYCSFNDLKSLDFSRNPELIYLYCGGNQLTSLNLGHNPALQTLNCESNQLSAAALDAMFGTLGDGNPIINEIHCQDNPGSAGCDRSIAEDKGWYVNTGLE